MDDILARMRGIKPGTMKGGRIKRSLRKQDVPVRHVPRDSSAVNPPIEDVAIDCSVENQDDDDIVVVSYTTSKSRRRIMISVAALEKKRAILGVGGVDDMAEEEPEKAVDMEELEKLAEKKMGLVLIRQGDLSPRK
ncbi:hypothetical protein LIER_30958 [Lithospermum erythrorhizon]|uniref:Uncharacterized protein n=1 Tax=Lithospermum erythrorhizon TaxID=34254 RepID=A0AAV3RPD7_LITER